MLENVLGLRVSFSRVSPFSGHEMGILRDGINLTRAIFIINNITFMN